MYKNLKATVDANNFSKLLENYGLNNFQHRLFIRMATFLHNVVNIEQAPKLFKDQIRMNVNINKGGYNLRNKFQSAFKNTQSLRWSYICLLLLKIYRQFYSRRLKNNFYTFRKLLYNNLNNHFVKSCQIFPKFDLWLKT